MTKNYCSNIRMSRGQLLYFIVTKFDALIPEINERFTNPKYGVLYGKVVATNEELFNCISGFSPQLLGVLTKRLTLAPLLPVSDELLSSIDMLIKKITAVAGRLSKAVKNADDYVSNIYQFLSSFLGTVDRDCLPLARLVAFVKDESKTKGSGFYGTQQLYAACYNYLYNTPTNEEISAVLASISEEKTAALLARMPLPGSGPIGSGTNTSGGGGANLSARLAALRSSGGYRRSKSGRKTKRTNNNTNGKSTKIAKRKSRRHK